MIFGVISGFTATGCSFVLDKNANQCAVDADCAHFGSHPSCQAGVCVPSGLGPPDCFFGTPSAQEEFANQCTTAHTFPFDNCARLGLCDATSLTTAFNTTLPPTQGIVSAPLVTQVKPSIFAPQTSCKGAGSMYDADPLKHLIKDIPNNYAFYYDMNGAQQLCLLDGNGNTVDVGESDVYPLSCGYSPAPGVADYAGPIQAIVFAVPAGSSQTSISAEAAHLVFATGGDNGKATPWIDEPSYFVRSSGTGTTQLPSRAIGIDPSAWWGIDRLSADNLVASMETLDPKLAEGGIGILSSDFADKNRANLRELAFQQRGQRYGYLADSSPESLDKANVRDGHYPIWGAIHFMAATTNGVPSDAAKALISQFNVPKLEESLVSAIIDAGFVPTCAMQVTHSSEVGPLAAYQPSFGCGCFFDKKANGTTTCKACTGNGDCPSSAPACNYGYCEKQ